MTIFHSHIERVALQAFLWMLCCCFSVGLAGEFDDAIPERLLGVGVDEKLGENVDLEATFVDQRGLPVSLGSLLKDNRPIILTLNYSNCPGLCVAQLNGLTKGINQVGSLDLGKDFKMVSISIDPRDNPERAKKTHRKYSEDLVDHHKADAWSFLTGSEKDIQRVAKSVGFRYTYDKKHDQFNHSAIAILIAPSGRMTRYLPDIGFTGDTLKMAIVEAGEGRVGSPMDTLVLWCSHYDAAEGRYSGSARVLLSIAAGMFVTLGLIASLPFWISRRFSNHLAATKNEATVSVGESETISHATTSEQNNTI